MQLSKRSTGSRTLAMLLSVLFVAAALALVFMARSPAWSFSVNPPDLPGSDSGTPAAATPTARPTMASTLLS